MALYDQAIAICERLVHQEGRRELADELAMSHNNLGWLFQDTKRLEKAESAYRNAVALQKQAVADFPDRPETTADRVGAGHKRDDDQ